MKYAILFATAVAAEYAAYATETSSSDFVATTVYPGYDHEPVTVTSQYQSVPTYDADASTWGESAYVSTVLTDYDGNVQTVTNTDTPITVYHESSTLTKYTTETAAAGYYPVAGSNGTYSAASPQQTKAYTELNEEVHYAKYKDLGPKALPGYHGSGLTHDKDHQKVTIKKYHNGKWTEHSSTYNYGAPKPSATTFSNPGTYTVPASDLTVEKSTTAAVEAHKTCHAGEKVTYGGQTTSYSKAGTYTAPYAAYHTSNGHKYATIKHTTIKASHAGHYTVAKPTTTSYDHDTTVSYPSTTHYDPGVYHYPRQTVTVTKSNQPYTCTAEKTQSYHYPSHYPTSHPHSTKKPEHHHKTSTKKHHKTSTKKYHTSTKKHHSDPTHSTKTTDHYATSKSHSSYPTSASADSYPTESSTAAPYQPTHTSSKHHSKPHHTKSKHHSSAHHTKTSSSAESYPTSTKTHHSHKPTTTSTKTHHSHTSKPTHTQKPSHTRPHGPDPSSDYDEPASDYGHADAGYVKRGGMLQRRAAVPKPKAHPRHLVGKRRAILV